MELHSALDGESQSTLTYAQNCLTFCARDPRDRTVLRNSPRPRIAHSPGGASQVDEDHDVVPSSRSYCCINANVCKLTKFRVRAEDDIHHDPHELGRELEQHINGDRKASLAMDHHIHGQINIGEDGEKEGEGDNYSLPLRYSIKLVSS